VEAVDIRGFIPQTSKGESNLRIRNLTKKGEKDSVLGQITLTGGHGKWARDRKERRGGGFAKKTPPSTRGGDSNFMEERRQRERIR